MEISKNILVHEEDVRRLNAILNKIVDTDGSLKSALNADKEREIVDLLIGKEPIYKHLESLKEKAKTNGELLLLETDWQEFINKLLSELESSKIPEGYIIDTSIKLHSKEEILLQKIIDNSSEKQLDACAEVIVALMKHI